MEINWLIGSDSKITPKQKRKIVAWINTHRDEIHDIFNFIRSREMEAVKIIDGAQSITGKKITIDTTEIHFFSDLILVTKSLEAQETGSNAIRKETIQLATIGIGCHRDNCCDTAIR